MHTSAESFLLLTSVLLVYTLFLYRNKDHRSAYAILFFFTLIIFYLPVLYYQVGFDVYSRAFSKAVLVEFTYLASVIFFVQTLIYLWVKSLRKAPFKRFTERFGRLQPRKSWLVDAYFATVMTALVAYLIVFRNQLPLYSLLTANELLERPDATGGVPLFFTVSSIYMVFAPSAYLYYYDKINSKILHVLFVMLVTIVLVAGGHKGLVAFFYIFIWFFPFGGKVSFASVVLFAVLLFTYGLTKGSTTISQEVVSTITESAFRRFSVTQGVGFLARLHMMYEGLFVMDGTSIKEQVFEHIYRSKGGSHPTMFIANVIVQYGYLVAGVVYTVYAAIVTFVAKGVTRYAPKNYFLLWNLFIILFLTGMVDFSFRTVVRSGVAIVNVLMVGLLLRVHLRSLSQNKTSSTGQDTLSPLPAQ